MNINSFLEYSSSRSTLATHRAFCFAIVESSTFKLSKWITYYFLKKYNIIRKQEPDQCVLNSTTEQYLYRVTKKAHTLSGICSTYQFLLIIVMNFSFDFDCHSVAFCVCAVCCVLCAVRVCVCMCVTNLQPNKR